MPELNPTHLFEQASSLSRLRPTGAPRQVDLRRAISSAYYGIFHFTVGELASLMVGSGVGARARHALVYRGIDHRGLRDLCDDTAKTALPRKYRQLVPAGFGFELQVFATSVIDLQGKRHRADYDPLARFRTRDATVAIATAKNAIRLFEQADEEQRKIFLTLLLCPIRA